MMDKASSDDLMRSAGALYGFLYLFIDNVEKW